MKITVNAPDNLDDLEQKALLRSVICAAETEMAGWIRYEVDGRKLGYDDVVDLVP